MRPVDQCITPGCCTCPDLEITRCSDCGYTDHDKAILMDHSYCRPSQKKRDIEHLNKCYDR